MISNKSDNNPAAVSKHQLSTDRATIAMDVLTSNQIIPLLRLNEPFRSNSFAIIAVQRGSFVFQYNFVRYELAAHDVYLISPGAWCELHNITEDIEFISLGFKRDYLKHQGIFLKGAEILQVFASEVGKVSLNNEEFEALIFAMLALKRKIEMPATISYQTDIISHSFLSVLYEVLIFHSGRRAFSLIKLTRQEELTKQFLNLLAKEFKYKKQVQDYAASLKVTSRYLSQVVKSVTGKTAGELVDEIVIKEAKILLSAQTLNVAQVAAQLNFSDQSFFGKFFKKNTGFSPSVYRNNSSSISSPLF